MVASGTILAIVLREVMLWLAKSEEADHIRELAEPHIARSGVVDTDTGKSKLDDIRTSHGMFLRRRQDDVVAAVEERIAEWTLLPVEYGEGLQVLRYEIGQKYKGVSQTILAARTLICVSD